MVRAFLTSLSLMDLPDDHFEEGDGLANEELRVDVLNHLVGVREVLFVEEGFEVDSEGLFGHLEVDLVADIFDEVVDEVQQKVGKDLWKKIGRGIRPT